jgi:glycerol uptake facilitator-like aquaporin/CheY-like chemotaxis protein
MPTLQPSGRPARTRRFLPGRDLVASARHDIASSLADASPASDDGHVTKQPHLQAWVSEFAGTAILLFASVLVARWLFGPHSALASAVPGLPGRMAIDGVVIGAIVGSLIISPLGRSSGGHFNPAVTVTLWLLRGVPGRDAAAYIAAQLTGSLAGVMLGRAVLGAVIAHPSVDYAAIQPAAGWSGGAVFAGEAICLAVLMALVVAFLDRPVLIRWTPAVVAVAVAVLIFAGGLTSGGSFNPARQFGPLLFAGRFSYLWAYLLGPIAGAVIIVALAMAVGLPQALTCSLCGTPPRDAPGAPGLWGWPHSPAERSAATIPGMACRILVVDDSESFRRTAAQLLTAHGLVPLAAACDGQAALAAVSADCPDGVLLDINLPGQDGFAVAALIAPACPAATIVLTSSDIEDVPRDVLRSCGAAAFVPKTALAITDLHELFAGPGQDRR